MTAVSLNDMLLSTMSTIQRLAATGVPASQLAQELEQFAASIVSACQPLEIWLFGSLARDSFTTGSDIDLAIIVSSVDQLPVAKKSVYGLGRITEWPLELLFLDRNTFERKRHLGGVCMIIADEGRKLFSGSRE